MMCRIAILFLLLVCLLDTPSRVHAEPNHPVDAQLLEACGQGDIATAQRLIQQGANVNALEDTSQCTPLWQAAAQPDDTKLIALLVRSGAKVDGLSANDETPLIAAASNGNLSNVKLLLKLGAKLEAKDGAGDTALSRALGKPEVFRYLLDHHASVKSRNKEGWQPLHNAAALGEIKYVKWLVEAGADVNAHANNGITPIGCISYDTYFELDEYLMAHGADINMMDDNGPVWSEHTSDPSLIIGYLKHGARINARNKNGWTPLHYAAFKKNADAVQLLISKGADINAKTYQGETVFSLAAKRTDDDAQRESIIALLIKAGERDAHQFKTVLPLDSDEAAIIYHTMSQAPIADGGQLFLMEKSGNEWRVAQRVTVWSWLY